MPIISLETLNETLYPGLSFQAEANRVSYKNHGPGQLGKWVSLVEGREDGWIQREEFSTDAKKKKIILSNPFLKDVPPPGIELALFSTLIENHDVYLWPGPEANFSECRPLSDSAEFWKKRNEIYPAMKADVEKSLSQQGIASEDFTVLDYDGYADLLKKLNDTQFPKCYLSPTQLDLTNCAFRNLEEIKHVCSSLEKNKITAIRLFSPTDEEMDFYTNKENFPNLKHIEIIRPGETCLNFLKGYKVTLSDFPNHVTELTMPANYVKELTIQKAPALREIILREGKDTNPSVNRIRLMDCPNLVKMDLQHAPQIKMVEVENCHPELRFPGRSVFPIAKGPRIVKAELKEPFDRYTQSIDFSKLDWGEDLVLDRLLYLEKIDLSPLPHLKTLTINGVHKALIPRYMQIEHLDLSHQSELRRLELKGLPKLAMLDVSRLQNVEEIVLENINWETLPDFSQCKKLKRLEISMENLKFIDFSKIPNLESLVIKNCKNLASMNFSQAKNLKNLLITLTSKLENINLTECAELEQVTIQTNTRKIIAPELKKLKSLTVQSYGGDVDIDLNEAKSIRNIKVNASEGSIKLSTKGCENLQRLDTNAYDKLEIQHLEDCKQLRVASFSGLNAQNFLSRIPKDCQPEMLVSSRPSSDAKHIPFGQVNRIHHLNQESSVSYVDLESILNPDGNTDVEKKPFEAKGKIKVTLKSNIPVTKNHYRFGIVNEIKMTRTGMPFKKKKYEVSFHSNVDEAKCIKIEDKSNSFGVDDIKKMEHEIQKAPEAGLGHFQSELTSGKLYPLPTQCSMNPEQGFKIFSNPKDAVTLFWHPQNQQYYIKLNPPHKSQNVEILYRYDINAEFKKYPNTKPLQSRTPLLHKHLMGKITKELKNHEDLKFLFSSLMSVDLKIKLLINYFNEFKEEALADDIHPKTKLPITRDSLGTLLACIKQKKGVCRHRSQSFMLLAQFLGVPARMIYNEQHVYCEVPFPGKNTVNWHMADLGGGHRLDLTDPKKRQENPFVSAFIDEKKEVKHQPKKVVNEDEKKWEQKYYEELSQLIKKSEIKSIGPLLETKLALETLTKLPLAPLLEIPAGKDVLEVKRQIVDELKNRSDVYANYLYIHSPEDFNLYLKSHRLENGKRLQVAGPLDKIIREGGTIIVNWSNFTPTQLASYKSIIDKKPTILGKSVATNVKVIGLKTSATIACNAFSSRCSSYTLNDGFYERKAEEKPVHASDEKIEINLYSRHDWREHFLGDIIFSGDQILLQEGPLREAIRKNCQLVIHNPPNDEAFNLLLRQIKDEKRVFYNGEFISIPDGLVITTDEKPYKDLSKEIKVEILRESIDVNREELSRLKLIPIGLHNIHELYERLCIDEKSHHAKMNDGFLENYDEEKNAFYITGKIPHSDWQILQDKIAEKYKGKSFRFILAAGAAIEKVQTNDASPLIIPTKPVDELIQPAHVMLSNDPDFLSTELEKKMPNAEIIDVTPETSFTELIAKLSIVDKKEDSSKVNFYHEEKGVLAGLRAGKNIILNGELSPTLYQQLLPMLCPQPSLYLNGGKLESATDPPDMTGRLYAVMPFAAKKNISLVQCHQTDFSRSDYHAAFPDEKKQVDQIFDFFELVRRLPHRGQGRPAEPQLTASHLKNMLHALKESKLHSHNPVKGLLSYDYPPQSEDYAYLNVLGKYLFRFDDKTEFRHGKLKRLVENFHIKSAAELAPHAWHVLNCFNGFQLNTIFGGKKLEDLLLSHVATPTLKPEVIDALWKTTQFSLELISRAQQQVIIKKQAQDLKEAKSHVAKRENQLRELLENKNNPLILLKGAPGVGKTFTVSNLKKTLGFESYDDIELWLTAKPDKKRVLLLDEANLSKPGTWDFLKGLSRDKKSVYYKGTVYKLSEHHKIIATGNPETYPQRSYHPFFQKHAETLHFKMPEDDYLEKHVLATILQPYNMQQFAKPLLEAYHLIATLNPTQTYSNRDLENVAQRFTLLAQEKSSAETLQTALLNTCIAEFAGTIQDTTKRKEYMLKLADKFGFKDFDKEIAQDLVMQLGKKLKIPKEKAYLIDAIEQDLMIRRRVLTNAGSDKIQLYYKQGILVEGGAGLGKSTVFKEMLKKNGFSKKAEDTLKKYYEISAGDKNAHEILKQAFREGAVVILDELNLDESLEKLLNQLLTGKPTEDIADFKPGFMVLASQNPSHEKGRKSVSQALRNRLHVVYMDSYSTAAMATIAAQNNKPHPYAFVNAFQRLQKEHPEEVNMRTYFTAVAA